MTAAEYLVSRGWLPTHPAYLKAHPEDEEVWFDPRWTGAPAASGDDGMVMDRAITIQRARDAAEERAAWVAFAAAAASGLWAHTGFCSMGQNSSSAEIADEMLAEYRARFAVEVTP